jgi:exodeoxyribonuclease VII small subunit
MAKKYEDLMGELKDVLIRIESGEAGLDESILLYEQGTRLIKQCEELLAEAELKITRLSPE